MLIRSRDIRDQSSKLFIAKNFGRFFGRHKFFGVGIVNVIIVSILSPLPGVESTEKSREDTFTSPEVIESNRLIFRPNF